MLFDAKSIFAGGGRYRGSAEVREDQSGAVEQRARQVPSEYRRTAREKDQQYGPAGSTLIQDRVASFGACRAVVFGNYGEASRDVHTLIHVVEQMMQQEAMRVRLHGQPAAEPPYADFFAWAGQQPAAARGGGGG